MKREFKSCADAIKWIMNNAITEVDFRTLREELDFNHIFTGQFFVHVKAGALAGVQTSVS